MNTYIENCYYSMMDCWQEGCVEKAKEYANAIKNHLINGGSYPDVTGHVNEDDRAIAINEQLNMIFRFGMNITEC